LVGKRSGPRWPIRAGRPLRTFVTDYVASAALIAGARHIPAQAIASHGTKAPANFSADHIELQDKQEHVILSGDVDITQADAAEIVVLVRDGGARTMVGIYVD